jgi:hypothetical protein
VGQLQRDVHVEVVASARGLEVERVGLGHRGAPGCVAARAVLCGSGTFAPRAARSVRRESSWSFL